MEELLPARQSFAGLYKIVGLPLHRVAQLWTGVAARGLFVCDCAGTGVAFPNSAEPHNHYSRPTISSLSKDERKAATRLHKEQNRKIGKL
jgi:hypothetical protein